MRVFCGENTGKQLAEMNIWDKHYTSTIQELWTVTVANTLEFPPKPEPVYVTPWGGEQEASDTCILTGGLSPGELCAR